HKHCTHNPAGQAPPQQHHAVRNSCPREPPRASPQEEAGEGRAEASQQWRWANREQHQHRHCRESCKYPRSAQAAATEPEWSSRHRGARGHGRL
ncbi:unnamed protein product, partial [Ectocarpus fasciculatus]